jgi:hypothetical protein
LELRFLSGKYHFSEFWTVSARHGEQMAREASLKVEWGCPLASHTQSLAMASKQWGSSLFVRFRVVLAFRERFFPSNLLKL